MGYYTARLRLVAALTRRRLRHHPRQCSFANRRVDQFSRWLAFHRLAFRYSLAPRDLLAQPGTIRIAGCRRTLLSPLYSQPVAASALSALHFKRIARRLATPAGSDRA